MMNEYYSVADLAQILNVRTQTVYLWMRHHKIPCRKIGASKCVSGEDMQNDPFLVSKLREVGWKIEDHDYVADKIKAYTYLVQQFDAPENKGFGPHKVTLDVLVRAIARANAQTVDHLLFNIARQAEHDERCRRDQERVKNG